MNVTPENIIVNSCEYTPVYLIQSPGVSQTGSYYISQCAQEEPKPITDNLKRYYENSGCLENGILCTPSTKPRILKKQSNGIGNNLKLASFLQPKSESILTSALKTIPAVNSIHNVPNVANKPPKPVPIPPVPIPVSNVPAKPVATPTPVSVENAGFPLDRKIIWVGTIPNTNRSNRSVPKMKPKEKVDPNPSKTTSVQLLKLGETYHSLNQLSDDQMKIVNKALKIFGNPEQAPKEPAYDPVTNTKFIYKVVSPKELTVVGRNKMLVKKKVNIKKQTDTTQNLTDTTQTDLSVNQEARLVDVKQVAEIKKPPESKKLENKKVVDRKVQKSPEAKRQLEAKKQENKKLEMKKQILKKIEDVNEDEDEDTDIELTAEPKVTRSGRTVKPKQIESPQKPPQKPRKRAGNVVNCFQCSAEFCSLYRLQRHYESHPTHIPARIHTNLFHCLVAIIKAGSDEDQANIFIQQLQHLVEKLKTLLPCLLKKMGDCEGKQCCVNEDISSLFGLEPGEYHLNMNALGCIKDKDGHCVHNPAPKNIDPCNPPQEDIPKTEVDTDDCARINSVDKWPTVSKRIWQSKQQNLQKAKKIRLASENELIELLVEDIMNPNSRTPVKETTVDEDKSNNEEEIDVVNTDEEKDDCARVNTVDSWLKANKRVWKSKQIKTQNVEAKKVKLTYESDQYIDLGVDDNNACDIPCNASAINETPPEENANNEIVADKILATIDTGKKQNPQFRSTHFDIRSSPIKLPSALVRKFQLRPENTTSLEVQILQPFSLSNGGNDSENNSVQEPDFKSMLEDNNMQDDNAVSNDLNFNTKVWDITSGNVDDNFMKSNLLFDSSLDNEKSAIDLPLINVKDKNFLFDSPSKALESTLIHENDKTNKLIEQSLMHLEDKSNCFFETSEPNLLSIKDNPSGFYEPAAIHVKTPTSTLIDPSMIHVNDKSFEEALSSVRERSNNLFEPSMLLTKPIKCNSMIETPTKSNGVFDSTLSHITERSKSLYDSGLMRMKDNDSLIGPSLLQDNSVFDTISPRKDFIEPMIHNGSIEVTMMNLKDDIQNELITSDSSQGQSVLNFLDALGNEPLGLAYPETEIRNNSVDFQLDLFSLE